MPSVHLLGIGSIGSLIAFYLQKSKAYNVVLLQRSPEAIVSSLILERDGQQETLTGFDSEVVGEPGDVIKLLICSVKVQTTLASLSRLKPRLNKESCIVFLQNGMGIDDELRCNLFSPEDCPKMVSTSIATGAYMKANRPDLHVHLAAPGSIQYSLPPNGPEHHYKLAAEVLDSMHELRFQRLAWDEFRVTQIKKLIVNITFNPTTALLSLRAGDLRSSDQIVPLWKSIIAEAHLVLSKSLARDPSTSLTLPSQEELLTMCIEGMSRYAGNISSMAMDLRQHLDGTEIDFLNGYISKLGRELSIPTPVNDTIIHFIKARTDTDQFMLPPL